MKFSRNWLAEFVGPLDVDAAKLGHMITTKTAECEGVEEYGAHFANVCAARVVTVEPIAGSHNVKAVVETGRYGRKTLVCGAPNCRPGMMTAYFPLGVKNIAGVESDGMLASAAELHINNDNVGIIELEGVEPGDVIPGCAPDILVEIDNKSLTHRPDLWGHHGMAREVAAILNRPLKDPVNLSRLPRGESPVKVVVEDFNLCPRYSALLFDNVKVGPSPLWFQYRLQSVGLNPISNVVDVTNYIAAELAQPMHAFDADKIHDLTIIVRKAKDGEQAKALNGETYTLDSTTLVIADPKTNVAIAGVMGGVDSATDAGTTRILLESANFHAGIVRKTSSKLKLRTDASMRFEKSQDPANTVRALARAIDLLKNVCPGIKLVGGMVDVKQLPAEPAPIDLSIDWLQNKLGREISQAEVTDILFRLQFGITEKSPRWLLVTIPSWRATKDIGIKDDLVEEVGRMIGYQSIPPAAPASPAVVPPDEPERLFYRAVRRQCASQGFTEVYNYSFLSKSEVEPFGFQAVDHVGVLNPIVQGQDLLRASLLPGLLRNIRENVKHYPSFRLFEIGREIHAQPQGLPDEIPHFAAVVYAKDDGAAGLFELKRLAMILGPGVTVQPAEAKSYEHPARAANVLLQGEVIGRLFEFHPNMVEVGRAAVLDLDLRRLLGLKPAVSKYRPVNRFPFSAFDLSILCNLRELTGELEEKMRALSGPELVSLEYLRQYTGAPLPGDVKSVSFRITLGSVDQTLTNDEVTVVRDRVIKGLEHQGYELR